MSTLASSTSRQSHGARVSGRYMQLFAAAVSRLPEPERTAIWQAVPASAWDEIARSGLLGWLPGSTNLRCTRAVAQELGPERAHAFFRSLLSDTFQTPILRGIIEAALRFGFRDLTLYIPWVSRGFELLFQGCGRWAVVDSGPGMTLVEIRGLPRDHAMDPYWIQSVASAMSALYELVKTSGTSTAEDVDVEAQRATFRLRWRV